MCCRYYVEPQDEMLQQYGDIAARSKIREQFLRRVPKPLLIRGEIRPTDIVPVIATSRRGNKACFPMQWGFTHPKRGMLVFNTRMETAPEKDLFASSVNDRRCLIPASGYFEWKRADKNKKFYSRER